MLGAGQIENGMVNCDQEVSGLTFELARERAFTQIFDDVVTYETPELAR
jgi:hypothetical protein